MIVVSDAGPINYLVQIGYIELLSKLFGTTLLPSAVQAGLVDKRAPAVVREWITHAPDWLIVRDPEGLPIIAPMGTGETFAITLAKEIGANLLLCDDRKAMAEARRLGLTASGTLGVLLLAHTRSLADIDDTLALLERTNFHRGEGLFESVARRAKRMRGLREIRESQ